MPSFTSLCRPLTLALASSPLLCPRHVPWFLPYNHCTSSSSSSCPCTHTPLPLHPFRRSCQLSFFRHASQHRRCVSSGGSLCRLGLLLLQGALCSGGGRTLSLCLRRTVRCLCSSNLIACGLRAFYAVHDSVADLLKLCHSTMHRLSCGYHSATTVIRHPCVAEQTRRALVTVLPFNSLYVLSFPCSLS